ncbi:unnamed protein product [Caenorhabditis auriculariae]|uniref:C-type LECtin n=1 Tax=Caenorhabditis auriculariae TaxID=2777116 RepID=A0A8S1GSQ6_9PELO|nr:unnamed protein product [Caenorhabditis auriculariae]
MQLIHLVPVVLGIVKASISDPNGSSTVPQTAPSIANTTTFKMTTKTSPTTKITVAPPINDSYPCGTNYTTAWVDVMVLFDRSSAATQQGLDEMMYSWISDMEWFTLGKNGTTDPKMHTRVGIILYDSEPLLYAPLGSLDNDDLYNIDFMDYYRGITYTNIEAALAMAISQFNTNSHRKNVQKVIQIYGCTYRPNGADDPQRTAKQFKTDGGVIIVYDYIQQHGSPADNLLSLANPGYSSTSDQMDNDFNKNALCRANCRCPQYYQSFISGADDTPKSGCYLPVETGTDFQHANNQCVSVNNGHLAIDDSSQKLGFLISQFPSARSFWLGLHYDVTLRIWLTVNGEQWTNSSFSKWGPDQPKVSTINRCAYIPAVSNPANAHWAVTDCRNSLWSICESPPLFIVLFLQATWATPIVRETKDPSCISQQTPLFVCDTTSIVIIDGSTSLTDAQVDEEFSFIMSELVGYISFPNNQKVAFMTYGASLANCKAADLSVNAACRDLKTLNDDRLESSRQEMSLTSVLKNVVTTYESVFSSNSNVPILLFTGSKNTSDITAAGTYAKANMKKRLNSNFPYNTLWNVDKPLKEYSGMTNCLLQRSCADTSPCDIDKPPTTAHPYQDRSPQCNCNTETVWNDVMVLFDRSAATTAQGLEEMLINWQTDMEWFTVRKTGTTDPKMHTRVGIILYDSEPLLYAPLGSLDNDEIDDISFTNEYRNIDYTNIEAALRMAMDQFDTNAHRPNVRKVIQIYGTVYRPGGVDDPQQIANTFKEDGGVIIVYDYIEVHGAISYDLLSLATSGFDITSEDDKDSTFSKNALCRANCFCPVNYNSIDSNGDGTPKSGCYYAVETTNSFALAKNRCKSYNNGYIAVDESPEKLRYLKNQFSIPTNFWIGLQYDSTHNAWVSTDNATLTTSDYQGWGPGEPKYKSCAFSPAVAATIDPYWAAATDCRNSLKYVCEAAPCDSTLYCEDVKI